MERKTLKKVEVNPSKKYKLVLDSGAFTSWTRNAIINIDEYVAFIKRFGKYFDVIVNLDVLPGEFGRVPSDFEVEESARKSFENLCYLESKGINTLPVFHQGENLKWLDKIINTGHSYIGISPANDRNTQQKIEWLDEIFTFICDSNGYPRIKTHSFGATSLVILARYPFYSADSATWSKAGSIGTILIPSVSSWDRDYTIFPLRLFISARSPTRVEADAHYFTLPKPVREKIDEYIYLKGFTPQELTISWKRRDVFNAIFFLDVEKALQRHIKFNPEKHVGNIFESNIQKRKSLKVLSDFSKVRNEFLLYFATAWADEKNIQLCNAEVMKRLLSFHYFPKDLDESNFEHYIRSGTFYPYSTTTRKILKKEISQNG